MLPDLLYNGEKTSETMHPCTVSDLKIDALIGQISAEFLLQKTTKEDVLSRQQMFELLLQKPEKRKKIEERLIKLLDCQRLYNALKATGFNKSKHYIFVHLVYSLCIFYRLASENLTLGTLFDKFSAAFSDICKKEAFCRIENALNTLLEDVNSFQNVTLKINGENMVIERKATESYRGILSSCADELGIKLSMGRRKNIIFQDAVVDAISKLHPHQFAQIDAFYTENELFFDFDIFKYLPQFEFILSVSLIAENAKNSGIPYCFPSISTEKKFDFRNVYDISLFEKTPKIVPNHVYFDKAEPFFYLTGANGGGKTTYLRSVGIAALLFLGGCPVFCESGEAALLDFVFTHFPKDERFEGTGRFIDEENRVEAILKVATENSLILLNETYSSTNEDKSIEYTIKLANTIFGRKIFGLYITHQHRIDSEKPDTDIEKTIKIPFLSAIIDESDNNRRTFKIERRRISDSSFASDILKKYKLTKEQLAQRFQNLQSEN